MEPEWGWMGGRSDGALVEDTLQWGMADPYWAWRWPNWRGIVFLSIIAHVLLTYKPWGGVSCTPAALRQSFSMYSLSLLMSLCILLLLTLQLYSTLSGALLRRAHEYSIILYSTAQQNFQKRAGARAREGDAEIPQPERFCPIRTLHQPRCQR